MIAPENCATLDEVRAGIDALDRRIVPLLVERVAYARRAAALKTGPAEVPAPARAAAVVANVRALAPDPVAGEVVEAVYRAMIQSIIDMELRERGWAPGGFTAG